MSDVQLVSIADIEIGKRHRQEMGDIEGLAASIETLGLLQPIGVTPDYELIFGHRRLLAFEYLGRDTIPARIIDIDVLLGEHAENEIRKDFTLPERVAIGRAMEQRLGSRRGERTDLQLVENFPQVGRGEKTRDVAAEHAGFGSGKTYEYAKQVVEQGAPELVEAVENGKASISAAAQVATLPAEWQRVIVEHDEVAEAAKDMRQGRQDAIEERVKPHVAHNSGNNEWYTPREYIEAARRVLGRIDLDPASNELANEVVQADVFYTIDDDGLAQEWEGRVWMNPPYSRIIERFAEKLVAHYRKGDVTSAVVLVNNATETEWFRYMARASSAICFPSSRVKFWSPDGTPGAPLQGQAILYIGSDINAFVSEFSSFGLLVEVL